LEVNAVDLTRFFRLQRCGLAVEWLTYKGNLGLAQNTIMAYARALEHFFSDCDQRGLEAARAGKADIAAYVQAQISPRGTKAHGSAALSNATVQQRLTALRLFYDFLVEEGHRPTNPIGRGHYAGNWQSGQRGFLPRYRQLPWIPNDEEWLRIIECMRAGSIRNRLMFLFGYDCGLRREELCSVRTEDIDPALRLVRIRPETTKNRRGRVLPFSSETGLLLRAYLNERRNITSERGPLFVSVSNRNAAKPITIWTWSKVIRAIARRSAIDRFSTHTLRHLCLTDLARAGWEIHEIAEFAGHRCVQSTLLYIHISGRELAAKLASSMSVLHAKRLASVAALSNEFRV
jgi:site-specific recombinase XerD